MNKRIVISGAPGTGKTSIINKLLHDKEICHKEISREIISGQLACNGDITPWQNLNKFSELVIQKRIKQFNSTNTPIEFFDRSIIDSIAYVLKENLMIKKEWIELAKKNRYYKKVFIAPPWKKIYKKDEERQEDFETAKQIHESILKAYDMFEYQVIILPKKDVKSRIKFIKNQIDY
tara:strand:+ start:33 stop:563 length:531 start_codon:yes stop_codon:yes gene_type:complete